MRIDNVADMLTSSVVKSYYWLLHNIIDESYESNLYVT